MDKHSCSVSPAKRCLLLHDNSCCAIIKQTDQSNVFVVLSSTAEYCQIYYGGNHFKHLTRFIPTKFEQMVVELLCFRNQFSLVPYFCPRFTTGNKLVYNIKQAHCALHPIYADARLDLYLCPYAQRIIYIKKVFVRDEDTCIEQPLHGANAARLEELVTAYPLRQIPSDLQNILVQLAQALARSTPPVLNHCASVELARNGKDSARQATTHVETLMTCLSALGADCHRFLPPLIAAEEVGAARSLSTLTRAEYVDGDVYLISHDGRRARTQHEESVQRQLAEALQIIVRSHLPGGDTVRNLPDWCSAELEVEAWLQTAAQSDDARRWEQNDVILRLRGEYFTFMFTTTAGVREEKSLHSSFLHCELQRQAGILEVDDAGELVWQGTEQPDSTAANSIEDTESPALLLLRRYHKQALRLIRYRDHVLQQSRGTEPTENSAHSTRLLEQASHSSCSTVSKEMTDGSTFTAILKRCATKQGAAPYLMSLANVPLNPHFDVGAWPVPLRVDDNRSYPADCVTQINSTFPDRTIIKFDLQTQVFHVMLASGSECSFTLGSYKREEGIFAPHAHIPLVSNAFFDPSRPPTRNILGLQCPPPREGELDIERLSQYVRRILAFHRWADTPAQFRAALEEHDRRNAAIARASAMKTHHHLIIEQIATGKLTVPQAHQHTEDFRARLNLSNYSTLDVASPPSRKPASVLNSSASPRRPGEFAAEGMPSPFMNLVSAPVSPGGGFVRRGTTTVSSSSGGSGNSSLRYSPLSSPSSVPSRQPQAVNIVTPEAAQVSHPIVVDAADRSAGKYLYHNVRDYPYNNSFGAPHLDACKVAQVTPYSSPRLEELLDSSKPVDIHTTHIPHDRKELPQYERKVNPITAEYLSATYVKDALSSADKVLAESREYLRSRVGGAAH